MTSDPLWLSEAAYHRLMTELEELRTTGRTEASEAIGRARAHGDLRENAEYDVAKDEQAKIEARIRQLEDMLERAQVGQPPDGDVVAAGMVVTVVDEDGDTDEFLIGSIEDKPGGMTIVSASSPLGTALIGASVGDTVEYEAPAGTFSVKITDTRPHEA